MAELVDALDLESSEKLRESSSLSICNNQEINLNKIVKIKIIKIILFLESY